MYHVIARELLQPTCKGFSVSFHLHTAERIMPMQNMIDLMRSTQCTNEQCTRRLQIEFCRSSLKARLLSPSLNSFPSHLALSAPFLSSLSVPMIPLRRRPLQYAFILLHLNFHPNHVWCVLYVFWGYIATYLKSQVANWFRIDLISRFICCSLDLGILPWSSASTSRCEALFLLFHFF